MQSKQLSTSRCFSASEENTRLISLDSSCLGLSTHTLTSCTAIVIHSTIFLAEFGRWIGQVFRLKLLMTDDAMSNPITTKRNRCYRFDPFWTCSSNEIQKCPIAMATKTPSTYLWPLLLAGQLSEWQLSMSWTRKCDSLLQLVGHPHTASIVIHSTIFLAEFGSGVGLAKFFDLNF